MIEEAGVVVTVEPDAVWVATQRKTTCGSCSARITCGQGLMTSLASDKKPHLIKISTDLLLREGDQVTLGMPEELLVRSARSEERRVGKEWRCRRWAEHS